jgi:hypothetical protein
MLTLRGKIKIEGKYRGSSKFEFWSLLKVGDIVSISTEVKPIVRGNTLYATTLILRTNELKFTGSINEICKYLSKLDFEEVVSN